MRILVFDAFGQGSGKSKGKLAFQKKLLKKKAQKARRPK